MRVILLEDYGKNVKTWKILDKNNIKRIDEEYLKFDNLSDKFTNRKHAPKLFDTCLIVLVILYIFSSIMFLFIVYKVIKNNLCSKLNLFLKNKKLFRKKN